MTMLSHETKETYYLVLMETSLLESTSHMLIAQLRSQLTDITNR